MELQGLMSARKKVTKEEMIEAAIVLISRLGLETTSFQKIADECQVSQGAPLYHFKNKFGLFEAIASYIIERKQRLFDSVLEPTDNAYEKLVKFYQSELSWALIYAAEAEVYMNLFALSGFNPEFSKLYHKQQTYALENIIALLYAGKREQLFNYTADEKVLAQALFDFQIGMYVNLVAGKQIIHKKTEIESRIKIGIATLTGYKDENSVK